MLLSEMMRAVKETLKGLQLKLVTTRHPVPVVHELHSMQSAYQDLVRLFFFTFFVCLNLHSVQIKEKLISINRLEV